MSYLQMTLEKACSDTEFSSPLGGGGGGGGGSNLGPLAPEASA